MAETTASSNSSPTDFAFAPPNLPDHLNHKASFGLPPSSSPTASMSGSFSGSFSLPGGYSNNGYGYSSAASSFSSTGSATGSSFSSTDALPAISRDLVRPSPTETRRPATAGGALQGGPRFHRITKDGEKVETIDEESSFIDPFSPAREDGKMGQSQQDSVDPKYNPASALRRSSESQASVPQWQYNEPQPNFNILHQVQPLQSIQRSSVSRPQTSDGLPTYTGLQQPHNVSLPSARTIVGSLDSYTQPTNYYQTPTSNYMPFRDSRASMPETVPSNTFPGDRSYNLGQDVRPSYVSQPGGNKVVQPSMDEHDDDMTFVTLGGPAPKKRPRRRYDEIERLYACGWNGCEKSYGTLNHLNAHVAMQKHGEKRLPQEFKEMRKAWRKKKREAAASAAAHYMPNGTNQWNRASMSSSSESDFDRRESTASMMSDYSQRNSIYSGYNGYDSRPSTSSSVASSADLRQPMNQAQAQYVQMPAYAAGQGFAHPLQPASAGRRMSTPMHIPMPQQQQAVGFRQNDGDHPTPTPGNPFPGQPRQAPAHQGQGFFQTLTSPMPMVHGGYQQFAFQR